MTATPAALFIYDDRIVWGSQSFHGGETRRPAAALLIGTERPLRVVAEGRVLESQAVLVGPQVARRLEAQRAGFYSLTLDPAHPGCRWLQQSLLAGAPLRDLAMQLTPALLRQLRAAVAGELGCAAMFALSNTVLAQCCPGLAEAPAPDARVLRTAAWLRAEVPTRAGLRQLSAACGLSESRLTHLFTAELGVSIRSYLRWQKMCKAARLLGNRQTITEVAATVGFADAAHFTRVLRSYYAAAPSYLGNRELVRVHACEGVAAKF